MNELFDILFYKILNLCAYFLTCLLLQYFILNFLLAPMKLFLSSENSYRKLFYNFLLCPWLTAKDALLLSVAEEKNLQNCSCPWQISYTVQNQEAYFMDMQNYKVIS